MHEQLAGVVGPDAGDLVAVVVEQLDLDHRRRLAARARLAQLVLGPQDAVDARARCEPYTSNNESAGKSARYICFRAKLHGAALAIIRFIDDVSYLAFTSSGRLQIIRIGVGRENVEVTLYVSTRRSQSSGSNLRCSDDGLAERLGDAHEAARTGVVQRPGR